MLTFRGGANSTVRANTMAMLKGDTFLNSTARLDLSKCPRPSTRGVTRDFSVENSGWFFSF
jgi:hypothetical protein